MQQKLNVCLNAFIRNAVFAEPTRHWSGEEKCIFCIFSIFHSMKSRRFARNVFAVLLHCQHGQTKKKKKSWKIFRKQSRNLWTKTMMKMSDIGAFSDKFAHLFSSNVLFHRFEFERELHFSPVVMVPVELTRSITTNYIGNMFPR